MQYEKQPYYAFLLFLVYLNLNFAIVDLYEIVNLELGFLFVIYISI